jgi:hypothetical protein
MPQEYDRGRIKGVGPRTSPLIDQIGRGYRPNEPSGRERMVQDMQAEAAGRRPTDADVNDDFARRLQKDSPPAGKVKRTQIRGRGQVKMAWDDRPGQYRYHYSPEENFKGIQSENALDPRFKGRHGPGAKGVHFMDDPNTYRPIGDRPMNVYRTPVEGKDWQNVSTDDFYTTRRVEAPEVYAETPEGMPRWSGVSNAYSKGATGLGLYNMLAAFMPGVLPSIQGPQDWVLGDVLQNGDASPYNPKNQEDT